MLKLHDQKRLNLLTKYETRERVYEYKLRIQKTDQPLTLTHENAYRMVRQSNVRISMGDDRICISYQHTQVLKYL